MSRRSSAASMRSALALLLVLVVWTVLVLHWSPERLVDSIGVHNGYMFSLVAGFTGGFSLFVTTPYYLVVATLGAGGLHPLGVGICAAAGVALGDSVSYLMGRRSVVLLPRRASVLVRRVQQWCARRSPWHVTAVLFLYAAVVPLPNDLLIVSLGLAQYPYRRVLLSMALGGIVFNTIVAYGGAQMLAVVQ